MGKIDRDSFASSFEYRKSVLGKKVTLNKEKKRALFGNGSLNYSKEIYIAKIPIENSGSLNVIYKGNEGHHQGWYITSGEIGLSDDFLDSHPTSIYASWNIPIEFIDEVVIEQLEFDFGV